MSSGLLSIIHDGVTHRWSTEKEDENVDYLHRLGFSWETAIDIAAWATIASEGSEYEQDEVEGVEIYIEL